MDRVSRYLSQVSGCINIYSLGSVRPKHNNFMILSISYEFTMPADEVLFEISADNVMLLKSVCDGRSHTFEHEIQDVDHHRAISVELFLSGKSQKHTVIDPGGNIIGDCAVLIPCISFDAIDVTDLFCQGLPCYHHDHNGSMDQHTDEFYGYMGFNGRVEFPFFLPIHQWFLAQCQ